MSLGNLILDSQGHFIKVRFLKRDGTVREMLCRLGVKKHLKGGTSTLNPSEFITVWDINAKGYRAINRHTILSVTFGGVSYLQVNQDEAEPSSGYVNQ